MFFKNNHLELYFHLVTREIESRFKGSFLGVFWIILVPILSLSVYTLVFGKIFEIRWNSSDINQFELASLMYCGLLLFQFFSESINQALSSIVINSNYVKKVVFPLYLLPAVKVGAALFHSFIGFIVLSVLIYFTNGKLHLTSLYIFLVFIPLILFTLGLSWILASLCVYFRDISHGIGIIISLLLFLCPIFYPVEAIPENLKSIIYLNPLTTLIEEARNVIFWGETLNFKVLFVFFIFSICFSLLGKKWFEKTEKGFVDVL